MRDDMRTTSEELLADASELADIERRKLEPTATPAELERLSIEAAELTSEMAHKAQVQKRLARGTNRPN